MNTRKTLSALLIGVVLNLSFFHATALANSKEEKLAAKVKAGVIKLGTGKDARVSMKLKDGTKVNGYISESKAEGFVVMNETTGVSSEIQYSNAKQVR